MEIYKNKNVQLSFLETSSSKNQTVLSLRALATWSACFLCPHRLPGLSSCYEAVKMCSDSFSGGSGLDPPSPSRV